MPKLTKEDVMNLVAKNDVHFIRLQFTDILGIPKNVSITTKQLEKALNNELMFDGSSIEGFVRIEESDMYLHPDPNSFVIYPWQAPENGAVARLVCDILSLIHIYPGARNYLAQAAKIKPTLDTAKSSEKATLKNLSSCILNGQAETVTQLVSKLIDSHEPLTIIDQGIIPALVEIGDLFAAGKAYLPQLMLAGDAAKAAFEVLKEKLPSDSLVNKGTVVIGTVQGDVHDIGKNIVSALLENHGFRVIDLGKNVQTSDFIDTAKNEQADVIALSALMTTTAPGMAQVIQAVQEAGLKSKVIVGGAVVTADFAKEIGADGYGKDAVEAVKVVQNWLEER